MLHCTFILFYAFKVNSYYELKQGSNKDKLGMKINMTSIGSQLQKRSKHEYVLDRNLKQQNVNRDK